MNAKEQNRILELHTEALSLAMFDASEYYKVSELASFHAALIGIANVLGTTESSNRAIAKLTAFFENFISSRQDRVVSVQ